MSRYFLFFLFIAIPCVCLSADEKPSACQSSTELENNWAKVRYQVPENMRMNEFNALLISMSHAPLECLNSAEYQIVEAMIKGSMAKLQSRLSALKKIHQIKRHLEKAIKKKPVAMNGQAWILLGLLYDKSPGWPLSIGDDEKAEKAYLEGLKYSQDGLDANYYYGDFLRRKGLIEQAQKYLLKASQLKQRRGHEIADQARLQDVQRSLAKLKH